MAKKAAKKPKAKAKARVEKQEDVRPSEVLRMIGERDFTNLVRRCNALKKQNRSISGEMGELVKTAVENKHLDRVAFAMFRRLNDMAPEKLATTLSCLRYYIDVGKLDEIASEQAEFDIPRPEAGETEAEPEPDTEPQPLRLVTGGAAGAA